MATIVFASTKGGVGKTTSALTLAFVLTHHGMPVTLVDADPNHPIERWANRFPNAVPSVLHVTHALGSDAAEAIDSANTPFVIVDLEGSRNVEVSVGLGRADLALIPMRGSQLDADEAATVIRLIRRQETVFRREIPFRVFMSCTSPVIEDKAARRLSEQFRENSIPMLNTSLVERAAFRAPFNLGVNIYDLSTRDVRNPTTAIENAETFAIEVRDALSGSKQNSLEKANV